MMPRVRTGWIFLVFALSGLCSAAAISQGISLPEAAGKQQVLDSCTRCHGVDVIVAQQRAPDEWAEVVSVMVGHGAALTDDEYNKIVAYLATNLSSSKSSSD
jgi:mono/diheme cytochrome c family protein